MIDRIEEIKDRVSILDICRRAGIEVNHNNQISAPWRGDSNPSVKIYPESNSFNDFGSDIGGSVIDFYMAVYGIADNKTAIDELASLAGIENCGIESAPGNVQDRKIARNRSREERDRTTLGSMTEDENILYNERLGLGAGKAEALRAVREKRLLNNMEVFQELFNYCQKIGWDERAYKYLIEKRKIPAEAVEGFYLFYIKDYYATNNHLKKVLPLEQLQKSGLFNEKGNLIFYNHRIVIPYWHGRQVKYLRARFWDQEKGSPATDKNKYLGLANDGLGLNTPKRFFNADILTRLYEWERLYIVEGEFDCIIMQAVIKVNCVAIPGVGNIPETRLRQLKNFEVIICPDGDEAGSKMVDKLTAHFQGMGKQFSIKQLPTKDVNDFVIQNS